MRYAPARAVPVELARSLYAQTRLQRTRPVVDARVNDARAVSALVGREPVLALEHAYARMRLALDQLTCDREPENSAPDHGEIASRRCV